MKYLILLSLVSSQSYANVIHLNAGEKAPTAGYLFDEGDAQNTRIKLLDCDELSDMNTSLQKSVDIYKKNQDLYNKQSSDLLTQNQKLLDADKTASTISSWEKFGYFFLGIIATGLSFEIAKGIIKN